MTKKNFFAKLAGEQESDIHTIKYYVNNCADIIKEIQEYFNFNFDDLTDYDKSLELYNLIGKLRNNQEFLIYAAQALTIHNQLTN